jgi:hypothetical protein
VRSLQFLWCLGHVALASSGVAQIEPLSVRSKTPSGVFQGAIAHDTRASAVFFSSDCVAWALGSVLESLVRQLEVNRGKRMEAWLREVIEALSDRQDSPGAEDMLGATLTCYLLLRNGEIERLAVGDRFLGRCREEAQRVRSGRAFVPGFPIGMAGPDAVVEWQAPVGLYEGRGTIANVFRAVTYLRAAQGTSVRPEVQRLLEQIAIEDRDVAQSWESYRQARDVHWKLWGSPMAKSGLAQADWVDLEPQSGSWDMLNLARASGAEQDDEGRFVLAMLAKPEVRSDLRDTNSEQAIALSGGVRADILGAISALMQPRPAEGIMSGIGESAWRRRREEVGLYSYVWLREVDALMNGVPLLRSETELRVFVEPVPVYYGHMVRVFEALGAIAAGLPRDSGGRWVAARCSAHADMVRMALEVLNAQGSGDAGNRKAEEALRRVCLYGLGDSAVGNAGAVSGIQWPWGSRIRRAELQGGALPLETSTGVVRAVMVLCRVEVLGRTGEDKNWRAPEWSVIQDSR